jgi:Ca2+-binding EF-hand superfamily protein
MSVLEVIGMSKSVIGGIVFAALFAGTVASARSASTTSQSTHARGSFFTSNQNRSEVPARIEKMFKQLDVNHDGFVTKDEIAALQARFDDRMSKSSPSRAAKMFDRMDTNHDGRITQAEVDATRAARATAKAKTVKASHPSALFLRADANKDGIVTRAEFDAATTSGKIKLHHAAMRGSAIVRLFDAADTNKDGRVSLEEARQIALRQFDAADADHNGVLTPEERRQASKAERKARLAS